MTAEKFIDVLESLWNVFIIGGTALINMLTANLGEMIVYLDQSPIGGVFVDKEVIFAGLELILGTDATIQLLSLDIIALAFGAFSGVYVVYTIAVYFLRIWDTIFP